VNKLVEALGTDDQLVMKFKAEIVRLNNFLKEKVINGERVLEEAPKELKKFFFRTARIVGKEMRVHIEKQKKAAEREEKEVTKAFRKKRFFSST
jgi:hypothetical protein